jgi:predicted alpha/beta hydrolase family esterase
MNKLAVILHGTDSNPESNWFSWLKKKLEDQGYRVWVPLLPNNHTPSRDIYNDFLLDSSWDFSDNIVVGHSSGAVSVLNLLMDKRCTKIKLGVMVSAWDHGVPDGMDTKQFAELFPQGGFDFETIKHKADKLAFLHSRDDPYCPLDQAEYLSESLEAPLVILDSGGHLGGSKADGFEELWKVVESSL